VLLSPQFAVAQGGGGEGRADRVSVTVAARGLYIELSRCNACAGPRWQQEAVSAFRARDLSAFAGNPKYDDSYQSIQFLEKLPRVSDKLTSVFVGPFQTENAASIAVSQIPSILRKQIAEDQGSPVSGSTGMFEVKIVRVRSAVATGGIDNLSADAYLIRPGFGIGKVLIGSARSDVEAVLGQPRYRSNNSDTWQSGDDSLLVLYSGGVVRQLEVSSSKFHTTSGLTAISNQQRFLQVFPKSSKQCCGIYGASGFSEWTCWDAISNGVALRRGSHSGGSSLNALIVHSAGQPARQSEYDDAECKPCR
jgi:hypothetical protein